MSRKKLICAGLVLTLSALTLAACSGNAPAGEGSGGDSPLAELEQAAFEEGELTVYTGAGESQIEALVDAFMDQYPELSVEYFRGAGTALFNRFATEAEAGSVVADVFVPTVQPSFVTDNADWFLPLDEELLPALADWPEEFRTEYTAQPVVEEIVAIYNTDTVDTPPETWEDVLDEKYRGRIVLIDPLASAGYMSWFAILREALGDDFLEQLGELDPLWVDTGAVGAQQVATGQYDIVVPAYPSHSASLIDQGAPLELIRNLEPTQGLTTNVALTADAPNPNAARLFANWLLSPEAYEVYCAEGVYFATIEGTDCPAVSSNFVEPKWDVSQEEQDEIVALLGR